MPCEDHAREKIDALLDQPGWQIQDVIEDIVKMVREEFVKGNDFAQKITYKTTGSTPEELIASFRNSYTPRIASPGFQ